MLAIHVLSFGVIQFISFNYYKFEVTLNFKIPFLTVYYTFYVDFLI
jgi:hypothetical protein